MFFVSFSFHVIWKISNFNLWTTKHLTQASCTELTLCHLVYPVGIFQEFLNSEIKQKIYCIQFYVLVCNGHHNLLPIFKTLVIIMKSLLSVIVFVTLNGFVRSQNVKVGVNDNYQDSIMAEMGDQVNLTCKTDSDSFEGCRWINTRWFIKGYCHLFECCVICGKSPLEGPRQQFQ